jgi:hypothetical protein
MHFWGQYKTIQNLLQLEFKNLDLKKINYIQKNGLDYLNFDTRLLYETYLDTPQEYIFVDILMCTNNGMENVIAPKVVF